MIHLIDKSALVAEIERSISNYKGILNKVDKSSDDWVDSALMLESKIDVLQYILSFLNTLEVKDANEALRTEYEKGRHDVIENTLKWIWDLNQEHEIMSYTDSHVLSSEELQQYYKNIIEQ